MMPRLANALETAEMLKKAATDLLDGGVDKILSECGQVTYSGSYYLNLMAWPDLDLYLALDPSPEFRAKFLTLGAKFASACDLISLRFKDHVRYPEEPLPHGLYWGVRTKASTSRGGGFEPRPLEEACFFVLFLFEPLAFFLISNVPMNLLLIQPYRRYAVAAAPEMISPVRFPLQAFVGFEYPYCCLALQNTHQL